MLMRRVTRSKQVVIHVENAADEPRPIVAGSVDRAVKAKDELGKVLKN